MARGDGRLINGVFHSGGANYPGWFNNLGLQAGTTTIANDSIKVCAADGTDLGPENPGSVTIQSTSSPGLLVTYHVYENVTIKLTGAHWGEGGKGDLALYLLSVYAIDDAGTLKWGVSSTPYNYIIQSTDDEATATNVTTIVKVLVNASLTGDANCLEVGWFNATFDDAGGAAEDLWAVQTGAGNIGLGSRPGSFQIWRPTFSWTANVTTSASWKRRGENFEAIVSISTSGAPTSADLTFTTPPGLTHASGLMVCGEATIYDGATIYSGVVIGVSTNAFGIYVLDDAAAGVVLETVTQANPVSFGAGDGILIYLRAVSSVWGFGV